MESAESWAKGRGLSIWQGTENLLTHTLDALLPQRCLLCGRASGNAAVCAACSARLPQLPEPACPVCAHPHASPAAAGQACGHCLAHPPAYDATLAAYAYLSPASDLVARLKYGRRLASVDFLSRALSERLRAVAPAIDCIVPMPLSPQRLAERGFNQAVELARPLARMAGMPLALDRIARRHDAAHQANLPWPARATNIRGAFTCVRDFAGQHVLVVDDVMTTGATLNELAGVIKRHGALRVTNLVVARTLRR